MTGTAVEGIDVSGVFGAVNWRAVRSDGISFAFVRATLGERLARAVGLAERDARCAENLCGAREAGIMAGVYHRFSAQDADEASAEARRFLDAVRPLREMIPLWAVCDCGDERFLPRGAPALTEAVGTFLDAVAEVGLRPMLFAEPRLLARLEMPPGCGLWLAYWGGTMARALTYRPEVWQYGCGAAGDLRCVHRSRGFFDPLAL